MTIKETFASIHREVTVIKGLLEEPEWGLISFNMMLADHLKELSKNLSELGISTPLPIPSPNPQQVESM